LSVTESGCRISPPQTHCSLCQTSRHHSCTRQVAGTCRSHSRRSESDCRHLPASRICRRTRHLCCGQVACTRPGRRSACTREAAGAAEGVEDATASDRRFSGPMRDRAAAWATPECASRLVQEQMVAPAQAGPRAHARPQAASSDYTAAVHTVPIQLVGWRRLQLPRHAAVKI